MVGLSVNNTVEGSGHGRL